LKTSAVFGASIWLFLMALLGATLHALLCAALYLIWAGGALAILFAEQIIGIFPGQTCPLRTYSTYDISAWMPEDETQYHSFYSRLSQPITPHQPVTPHGQITRTNHFSPRPEINLVKISVEDLARYQKHEQDSKALKSQNTRLREARRVDAESLGVRVRIALLDELRPVIEETTGGIQRRRTGFLGINVLSAQCHELETALKSVEWRLAASQAQVTRLQGRGREKKNGRKGVDGD